MYSHIISRITPAEAAQREGFATQQSARRRKPFLDCISMIAETVLPTATASDG
jgi:hypothetical protein